MVLSDARCENRTWKTWHIFLKCPFAVSISFGVMHILNIFYDWNSCALELSLQEWMYECKECRSFPLFIIRGFWRCHNSLVFEGQVHNINIIC